MSHIISWTYPQKVIPEEDMKHLSGKRNAAMAERWTDSTEEGERGEIAGCAYGACTAHVPVHSCACALLYALKDDA